MQPSPTWSTLPELVLSTADRFGDAEAIVDGDLRITDEEPTDRVRTAAGAYIEAGVRKGDRVAIWAPNSAEWIIAAFGLLTAGGVLVPANTLFKAAQRTDKTTSWRCISSCGPKPGWPTSKRQDTSNSSTRSR